MEYHSIFTVVLIIWFSVSIPCSRVAAQTSKNRKSSVSAILVFGDSTVDSGNNNYLNTLMKTNFPPYGMDFPNHIPTGRCSNGKLATDFMASYMGIKEYVPPYLNKSLTIDELKTGVSFASGGSGFDPLTAQLMNVISMQNQLEYFKEYKARLQKVMGKEQMENHIYKAVFYISCGTNDFGATYFNMRHGQYSIEDYQKFIVWNTRTFLQGLLDHGARKIGIAGLPPIGCLPNIITMHSSYNDPTFLQRPCIESYSIIAKDYNQMLQNELKMVQKNLPANSGMVIVYSDIYEPILSMIRNHEKYGFEEWRRGCCGTGLLEASYLCNINSFVCSDTSKFIFWDSIHPTEKVYYLLFLAFRNAIDTFT
ncbi:hypothetical protein ACHQM5_001195 [Ranunculus cassubicifolius]